MHRRLPFLDSPRRIQDIQGDDASSHSKREGSLAPPGHSEVFNVVLPRAGGCEVVEQRELIRR